MININATLLHDLLEIAVGTRVAQIEEHGIQDRFLWEMYALEVNRRSAPIVVSGKAWPFRRCNSMA
jgi:hypothetical protein